MTEQHKQLDDFFHFVSRLTIVFPIGLILIAIFVKLTNGNSQQKGFREYSLTPTPSKSLSILDKLNSPKKSTPSAKFNLTGPLTCEFNSESGDVKAYIKDKKILIRMNEKNILNNYLLNGDCIYIWKSEIYSGEKICGIAQQVSIVEGLLATGLLDSNFIFSKLGKSFELPITGSSQDDVNSALDSCREEKTPSSVQFEVPKNVLFKNKSVK